MPVKGPSILHSVLFSTANSVSSLIVREQVHTRMQRILTVIMLNT
jgi:hypothetical protein